MISRVSLEPVYGMRTARHVMTSIVTTGALALGLAVGDVRAQDSMQWIPTPSILPPGGKLAVVSGNPFAAGTFTLEFAMPDGYTLPPHTNPSNEHVTVQSGALVVGVGNKIDRKRSATLAAGDTASAPAGVPHWSIAKGATILIVVEENGPYGIAYMSKRDEPGSHPFPFGY